MTFKADLFSILPKNTISKIAGLLASQSFPQAALQPFLNWYCTHYKVNLEESAKPLKDFSTFNEFFTRNLKPNARPVSRLPDAVVSPTDGRIYSCGLIDDKMLLQVKNIYYSLTDLIGEEYADIYSNGYQLTIYLSPADYHRIHVPYEGSPESFSYFPGTLWPVNDEFLAIVGGLFSLNERLFTHMKSQNGSCYGLVKVGAMVVGKINVSYANTVSNSNIPEIRQFPLANAPQYKRGDEIGMFSLGSTVILLFPPNTFVPNNDLSKGLRLKMGEKIGTMAIA